MLCSAGYPRALPVVPRSLSPSYPRPYSVIPALAAGISPRQRRALRLLSTGAPGRAGVGDERGLGAVLGGILARPPPSYSRALPVIPALAFPVIPALAFPVIPALAAGISPWRARSPAPALHRRSRAGVGDERGLGAVLGEIPAASAGMTDLILRRYAGGGGRRYDGVGREVRAGARARACRFRRALLRPRALRRRRGLRRCRRSRRRRGRGRGRRR